MRAHSIRLGVELFVRRGKRLLHLFEANTSRIAVRRGTYLRGYAFRFIEYCSPQLTEQVIRAGIETPVE